MPAKATKSNPPAISVVVPAYNSNQTLAQTVESIEKQTFTDFELIIIDDRSTDDTPATIKFLSSKYSNIIPIRNPKNLDIGAVRNLAVTYATGKYIAFIDSDDVVSPKYLEKLHRLATDNKADIAVCGYREVYKNRVRNRQKGAQTSKTVLYTRQEAITDFLHYGDLGTFVWGKLIAKKLFDQVKFPEGVIFEDVATVYRLYMRANKIAYTPTKLYDYVQRTASHVHTHRNLRDLEFFLSLPDTVAEDLPGANPEDLLYFRLRVNLAAFNLMLNSKSLNIVVATRIVKFVRTNHPLITKLKLTRKEKIQVAVIKMGVGPYQFLHFLQKSVLGKFTR